MDVSALEVLESESSAESDGVVDQESIREIEKRVRLLEREVDHCKRLSPNGVQRVVDPQSDQSAQQFRLLVESVVDYAIFILDDGGYVTSWNLGAERIKGYKAEEIIGQHCSRFYPEEDVRAGKCERELEIAATVGRFENEGWRVRRDGSRFWANVTISRMINLDGKLIGFAKVTRDLTQHRALEEERIARAVAEAESTRLARAQVALGEALAAQKRGEELPEQLIGIVGHDLRSPLSSIIMGISLMLKRGVLAPEDAKHAARIARSADRMANIISQLLDFTRARLGGGFSVNSKLIDLTELCSDVIAEFEVAHPECTLRLNADAESQGVWDRERLGQVVANLIGNAVQHGKVEGPIEVRVRNDGKAVSLAVHNEGPPISPELLPCIFEPFRRTRNAPGLGLGLFIVREMVRAHFGEISVQSSEAEGTTFLVTLPREPPNLPPKPSR